MSTFFYKHRVEMQPMGKNPYKTVYIRQTHHEHARLRNWLVQVAEQIIGACEVNASAAEWFTSPMREFKKSRRGQYYSPEELITDMIGQLMSGKDMPESMIHRWNRLVADTEWEIHFEQDSAAKKPTAHVNRAEVFEW